MRFRAILCALFALAVLPTWGSDLPKLDVSASSAIIISAETGQVLWAKDADTPRFPASTTKVMTALLLIEHCKLDDIITAPKGITDVRESSMHLQEGEQVTVQDMLYALMLRSANDGCVAVADHISGSVEKFAALMNERAKELGCTHTHFDNPNGLNDANHTISAHDLAIIAREAMTHPEFRDVVHQTKHRIKRSINQKDTWMVNRNKWLRKDKTADGIKTGWTIPAGHCYVGSATRNGFRVITVVMHSDHWQDDHQRMLKWAYNEFRPEALRADHAALSTVDGHSIPTAIDHPRYYLKSDNAAPLESQVVLDPSVAAADSSLKLATHVTKGERIGTIRFKSENTVFEAPLLAGADYAPAVGKHKIAGALGTPTIILGAALAGGVIAMRRKARRMVNGRIYSR